MNVSAEPPLKGIGVLVTRPAHQAESLCRAITAAGGRALRFPLLAIETVAPSPELQALTGDVSGYDLIIFISPNAVAEGLKHFPPPHTWPKQLRYAAIGRATASALAAQGLPDALCPETGSDSESLLDLPEFQAIDGQHVLIVRGVGGRALLGETLLERGALVDYAEVYRRSAPSGDIAAVIEQARHGEIDVITLTSADALRHLHTLFSPKAMDWLRGVALVVVSARMVQLAQELGFTQPPWLADGAGDEAMLAALIAWRRAMTPGESA